MKEDIDYEQATNDHERRRNRYRLLERGDLKEIGRKKKNYVNHKKKQDSNDRPLTRRQQCDQSQTCRQQRKYEKNYESYGQKYNNERDKMNGIERRAESGALDDWPPPAVGAGLPGRTATRIDRTRIVPRSSLDPLVDWGADCAIYDDTLKRECASVANRPPTSKAECTGRLTRPYRQPRNRRNCDSASVEFICYGAI